MASGCCIGQYGFRLTRRVKGDLFPYSTSTQLPLVYLKGDTHGVWPSALILQLDREGRIVHLQNCMTDTSNILGTTLIFSTPLPCETQALIGAFHYYHIAIPLSPLVYIFKLHFECSLLTKRIKWEPRVLPHNALCIKDKDCIQCKPHSTSKSNLGLDAS